MKEIQTPNHKKIEADLVESPPIATEGPLPPKKKKKKKIYQLGLEVDDVELYDV
jgi:hypothetical protein